MAIKFEKIQPGMVLLDIHRVRRGNTMMTEWASFNVRVIEVDAVKRQCYATWNGNQAEWWSERRITKLRTKPSKAYLEQVERRKQGFRI
jgi:hypothetical protein